MTDVTTGALRELALAIQNAAHLLDRIAAASSKPGEVENPVPPKVGERHDLRVARSVGPWRPERWSRTGTDWPRIGGRDYVESVDDAFQTRAFRARYRPGAERSVYVGTCYGTRRLSEEFCVPLAKVSTCRGGRLPDRIDELRADRYGAEYRVGGERFEQCGWDDWSAALIPATVDVSNGSPVTIARRSLNVRLPETMTAESFDTAFDAEIRKAGLREWMTTEEGRAHCRLVGGDLSKSARFTAYPHDSAARLEPADEISVFRFRGDFQRLVKIVERIVMRHLNLGL